jgi:MPBQ/MSBQ methyltransferase
MSARDSLWGTSRRAEAGVGTVIAEYYRRGLLADVLGGFFEGSDFWNFGYRVHGDESQVEACERLMEELLAFLPEWRGRILDVACGKGATSRYLTRYFDPRQITGINISEEQLERCRLNAPEVRFLKMDAARLDFDDDSFQNVICVEAAAHFETREQFFREALRVLKPGGRLALSDALLALDSPVQPPENYLASSQEYSELLERAGFRDGRVVDATDPCWTGFSQHLADYLRNSLWDGALGWRMFQRLMAWLRWSAVEGYVLASGEKPP